MSERETPETPLWKSLLQCTLASDCALNVNTPTETDERREKNVRSYFTISSTDPSSSTQKRPKAFQKGFSKYLWHSNWWKSRKICSKCKAKLTTGRALGARFPETISVEMEEDTSSLTKIFTTHMLLEESILEVPPTDTEIKTTTTVLNEKNERAVKIAALESAKEIPIKEALETSSAELSVSQKSQGILTTDGQTETLTNIIAHETSMDDHLKAGPEVSSLKSHTKAPTIRESVEKHEPSTETSNQKDSEVKSGIDATQAENDPKESKPGIALLVPLWQFFADCKYFLSKCTFPNAQGNIFSDLTTKRQNLI
jgi:hypothetical protein